MSTWKEGIALGQVSSTGRMRHTRGDLDVYTKPGRQTNVSLKVHNLRISDDSKAWLVDVYYRVTEGRRDYTTFDFMQTVLCPIPVDAEKGTAFVTNIATYDRSWSIAGQRHDIMEVPLTTGTPIYTGTYRIDGRGDDEGHVFVNLDLKIPFKYLDNEP